MEPLFNKDLSNETLDITHFLKNREIFISNVSSKQRIFLFKELILCFKCVKLVRDKNMPISVYFIKKKQLNKRNLRT